MPTRNISLTDHFDRFIDENVASGRFQNASEVVREALRLLETRKREEELKLERLRAAVKEGVDALDRGEYDEVPYDEIGEYIAAIGRRAAKRARDGDK